LGSSTPVNRTDRLTGILIALQGGSRSASQLARRFEVSRRTVMRDIDALGEIGVPIVARPGRSGGYSIAEGYWLAPLQLTADEATALLFALDNLGDRDTSPLGDAHRTVVDKLHAVLNPDVRTAVVRNLASMRVTRGHAAPRAAVLAALRTAIERQTWSRIDYRGPGGSTTRTILPTKVSIGDGRWYVEAIDSLRIAKRVFRIDRIASLHPSPGPADAASIVAHVTSSRRDYHHPDHPEIRAVLTPRGTRLALDHPDLRESVLETRSGGELRFRCPQSELPYYGREFLRLGTEIRVLAPIELRTWMTASVTELLTHLSFDEDHAQTSPLANR